MHVILTGATGLVGSAVLHHILSLTPTAASTKQITRLSILSRKPDIQLLTHPRRPTDNTHTTIDVITHPDFTTYPEPLLSQLRAASPPDHHRGVAVIWALGMSQNDASSTEQYTEVTKTYAVKAAAAIATAWAPEHVNFVYVSGEGATGSPGRFTPLFGRVKGETERELLALAARPEYANLSVYNVRPAAVDSGARPGGQVAVHEIWQRRVDAGQGLWQRAEKTLLLPLVMSLLRAGWGKGMHSPTAELGGFLTNLGVGDGKALEGAGVEDGGWTVRNVGLRRLAAEIA